MPDTTTKKATERATRTLNVDVNTYARLKGAASDRMVGPGWLASKLLDHALDELTPPDGWLFRPGEPE